MTDVFGSEPETFLAEVRNVVRAGRFRFTTIENGGLDRQPATTVSPMPRDEAPAFVDDEIAKAGDAEVVQRARALPEGGR